MDNQAGSPRSFGLLFAAIFFGIGMYPSIVGAGHPHAWLLALAGVVTLVSLFKPILLQPLNQAWHRFGLAVAKVMNPIVLAIVFFGVFTPLGMLLRIFRLKLLELRLEPEASSYWVDYHDERTRLESLRDPF